ncbi:glycerol-3-phosphate 1-O-acyltransferase PlsY [Marinihelvus fidelis]|uniref:Glycerol-3-phosphate acyltransferase n=1 Tax=Marinihelvus fidelis TaxID=2613842 RepID=A0A5N0T8M8_9GAMM|nr:glycerol-3-phosphate 1-O-acyltransferase PlsY [Marinihelvus fidelis]KAA9130497.1 glycerol-3-phosphate 1-O-acyltransferase PlsY [Marinihelvus fidelis]
MTEAMVEILVGYLLGSVSGSLLLGKIKNIDIRTHGSGNAGGTNALRTLGFRFALGVIIIDVGKGVLAAGWAPHLLGDAPEWQVLACGFAAVFGHCYPVFHGFRGGKGAATAVGVLAAAQPWLLVPLAITWVLTLILSGYVGLATVLAMLSLFPAALWLGKSTAVLIFAAALGLFVAFTHRSNFRNLAAGTEHRFERVRLVNGFRRAPKDD